MEKIESKSSDEWRTPVEVFNYLNNLFQFDVDACASKENALCKKFYSKEDSFLDINLVSNNIFINPPYSNCLPFIKKTIEILNYNCLSVMLLKLDTSTKWFDLVKQNASEIWLITGSRLSFLNEQAEQIKGNNFCSMIAVFNPRSRQYNNAQLKFIEYSEIAVNKELGKYTYVITDGEETIFASIDFDLILEKYNQLLCKADYECMGDKSDIFMTDYYSFGSFENGKRNTIVIEKFNNRTGKQEYLKRC